MFAVLFATFVVLRGGTYGGQSGKDLFDLQFVLIETLVLLTSSFTCGLGMLALHQSQADNQGTQESPQSNKKMVLIWLGITFLLGLSFLVMELYEFRHLIVEGYNWQRSAFLSAFFTLVGTHGLHIFFGLIWLGVLLTYIALRGLTKSAISKLTLLSLFWHFLDIVWIFIFTIVYLMTFI